MFIIKHKNIFIGISLAIILGAFALIAVFGLHFGIDFKGGSLLEVSYTNTRPEIVAVQNKITPLAIGEALVQPSGTNDYLIKTRFLTENERVSLLSALGSTEEVREVSFDSIGPSVGNELAKKSILSIILVSIAVILFIAFAFRRVSRPISSWKYGVITIATLLYDASIPVGIFALMAHYLGSEIDTLFVVALLTILGISINDKIVVFDRIRENLKNGDVRDAGAFEEVVGKSISQTITRSINTSLTVILVLLSLFYFGPQSTKTFALMLTAGMFFGTYSSIFLASPLLVVWNNFSLPRRSKNKSK